MSRRFSADGGRILVRMRVDRDRRVHVDVPASAGRSSHLETRFGSTDEASKSAQSSESKGFQDSVMRLLSSDPGSGGLVERGLVTVDETGGLFRITDAGRLIVRP